MSLFQEEDDTVRLISRRNKKRGDGRQTFHFSDSDLSNTTASSYNGDYHEETTVFSDTLYGDSLPSMRAQLAASQMLSRSKRGELESSLREGVTRENFEKEEEEEDEKITIVERSLHDQKEVSTTGEYNSLSGKILPRKKGTKEKLMKGSVPH